MKLPLLPAARRDRTGSGQQLYQDLGEPGKYVDTYRMRIEGGYDSGEHKLRGGNVQIH